MMQQTSCVSVLVAVAFLGAVGAEPQGGYVGLIGEWDVLADQGHGLSADNHDAVKVSHWQWVLAIVFESRL